MRQRRSSAARVRRLAESCWMSNRRSRLVLLDEPVTAPIKEHAAIKTGKRNTQDNLEDGQYPFFVRSQNVERINSYSFEGEAILTAGDGVGTGKIFHYIDGRFDFHQRVYRISDFSSRLSAKPPPLGTSIIALFFPAYLSETYFMNRRTST